MTITAGPANRSPRGWRKTASERGVMPDAVVLNPSGLCQCGCGQSAPIARYTQPAFGWRKGQPVRFIRGHANRDQRSIADRFWSYVDRSGGPDACWPWLGARKVRGYGVFWIDGKTRPAHVVAYELAHGPILPGYFACHHCDNPPCCNDTHLFAGTNADNIKDAQQKGRLATGVRHGSYLHPESRPYGEAINTARLTAADVQTIRQAFAAGGISRRKLARQYHVSPSTIDGLINNKTWRREQGL